MEVGQRWDSQGRLHGSKPRSQPRATERARREKTEAEPVRKFSPRRGLTRLRVPSTPRPEPLAPSSIRYRPRRPQAPSAKCHLRSGRAKCRTIKVSARHVPCRSILRWRCGRRCRRSFRRSQSRPCCWRRCPPGLRDHLRGRRTGAPTPSNGTHRNKSSSVVLVISNPKFPTYSFFINSSLMFSAFAINQSAPTVRLATHSGKPQ